MTVKTPFTRNDFENILSHYTLGTFIQSEPIQQGTVQTNYFIQTTQGKFVLRYYENRSQESVLFESDLLVYLTERHYPCPAQFKNVLGAYVSMYCHKPLAIFEFMVGQPIEQPDLYHWQQLIQKAAELQKLTANYRSQYVSHRWNYDADLCQTLARAEAEQIKTQDAREKFAWLAHELTTLDLPSSLPKGICHCDFHFSNVLFQGDEFAALLDFDDANYTFLQFDLVGLIEYWAWPHTAVTLDLAKARSVVQEYRKHRPLPLIEQRHLFDVYKLSILFDCVWFFERGATSDFREKRKIEALNALGRRYFFDALFHK
ncbi:MAG: homoserine kinase [Ardenticatenaceae bacterium]|nr:homoserine kinase [Ardenticatenaceae bacterium]MCB9442866.1 homoserine kinase [Ardenticatenaceae bacterium]